MTTDVDATVLKRAVALDLLNSAGGGILKTQAARLYWYWMHAAHQISDPLVEAYLQIKTQGRL